jgi:hypothetical protein
MEGEVDTEVTNYHRDTEETEVRTLDLEFAVASALSALPANADDAHKIP